MKFSITMGALNRFERFVTSFTQRTNKLYLFETGNVVIEGANKSASRCQAHVETERNPNPHLKWVIMGDYLFINTTGVTFVYEENVQEITPPTFMWEQLKNKEYFFARTCANSNFNFLEDFKIFEKRLPVASWRYVSALDTHLPVFKNERSFLSVMGRRGIVEIVLQETMPAEAYNWYLRRYED